MDLTSTITMKLQLTTGEEIENKWEELSARNGCIYDTDDDTLTALFSNAKSGNDILNLLEQIYQGCFRYTNEDGTIKNEYNDANSLHWVSDNIELEQRIATIAITEIVTLSIEDEWNCDGMCDTKVVSFDYVDGSILNFATETNCPTNDEYFEHWDQVKSWLEKFSVSQKIEMLERNGFMHILGRSNDLDEAFEEVFRDEFFFGDCSSADEFIETFE